MRCVVYKGANKEDHFLFLSQALEELETHEELPVPAALLHMLGELSLVIEFDLQQDQSLAQADAAQVIADIQSNGFYLQMPKKDMRAEEARWFS